MSPNPEASVKARLLAGAHARGEEFERALSRYAAERVLYRLGACVAREHCILKGAQLLTLWLPEPYRATRDIDLLTFGRASDDAVREIMQDICAVPCPEDGLTFDLTGLRIDEIRAGQEYPSRRASFVVRLGQARIKVQLDFGFGDALATPAEDVEYPTILDGLPPPQVRAYPKEATVAEKFQAMVVLDTRNSRMKDFHDVWALAAQLPFGGASLRRAVEVCFERRRTAWTEETPSVLTAAFYKNEKLEARWRAYAGSRDILAPPPSAFEQIGEVVIRFMASIRESIVAGSLFDKHWSAGGPWR